METIKESIVYFDEFVFDPARRICSNASSTMWATIKWSYDLLEENEKNLFRKLAVFSRGGLGERLFRRESEKGCKMPFGEALAFAGGQTEFDNQTDEIIIETHKFERITIEEEITFGTGRKTAQIKAKTRNLAVCSVRADHWFYICRALCFLFWVI